MSIYVALTANQNRLKAGGKYVYIYIYICKYYNKHKYTTIYTSTNTHLINFYEMFSRPQTTQLQDKLFQLLITFLKVFKFSADYTWCGREFHILVPKLLRLLVS